MKIIIAILFTSIIAGCKKEDACTWWLTDTWCEPIPGSGATGCSRSYNLEYKDCESRTEGETVMYRNDGSVKYYRLYKNKK